MTTDTDDYVRDVCKMGQGALCCRYLMHSPTSWVCGKLTELKLYLDGRAAAGTMTAQGDNCEGRLLR